MNIRPTRAAFALAAVFALAACGGSGNSNAATDSETKITAAPACHVIRPDDARGGRNVLLRCSGRQVIASAEAQKHMDPSVRIHFGKGGGKVIKADIETRQAANATGKSDDAACQRAFVNAIVKFQKTAKKMGGNGVSHFRSYLDRNTLKNGEYDCEVGTFHARVLMKGSIVR
ncbi:MAG: hypothetical protein Q4D61_03160 [Cardiobacteriaceae bacterium]|nr:hypothetical protein [Cardiobacteriaceae bacterium]